MRACRLRIGSIMVFVALVGLNFGAIRAVSGYGGVTRQLVYTGVLPTANVLAIGLLIGHRSRGNRRFLLGFEVFGVTALAFAIAGVTLFQEVLIFQYLHLALIPYRNAFGPNLTPATVPMSFALGFYVISVSMLGLPQLALALFGGFLSGKLRITEPTDTQRDGSGCP